MAMIVFLMILQQIWPQLGSSLAILRQPQLTQGSLDPQGGMIALMEEDPGEDPVDEDQPEEEELSAGSRAVSVGGRSEVSTDTVVAIAALAIDIVYTEG
ncbi:hypothetical protein PIB30_084827 [Stylosanthes scabra]|uniref:Uncharacterized protein n=1 Tax=Stylosanthes scabra TaxID=79078 RepID=A0ABU6WQZ3_9FABA|nr:hypothetical protein [Stylosanthes scabra]